MATHMTTYDVPSANAPLLIGRTAELALLASILPSTGSAPGQVALITGDAGIGKSRLVAEMRVVARRQGLHVLQGQCFEPDRVVPYAPLIDLLRPWLASHRAGELTALLGPDASELAMLMPVLHGSFPDLPISPIEPAQSHRRRCQALATLVEQLTRDGPLLLILEDLHWCDEASLEVLLVLSRRVVTLPLLLLLTYRAERVPAGASGAAGGA